MEPVAGSSLRRGDRMISRRDLVLAAAGACISLDAAAEQSEHAPTIGVLSLASRDSHVADLRSLRGGLRELGYIEGRTLFIEERYADGHVTRLPALLDDLLRHRATL